MVYEYSRLLGVVEAGAGGNLPPEGVWYYPRAYPVGKWGDEQRLDRAGAQLFLWSNRSVLCIKSRVVTECFSRDKVGGTKSFGLSAP